MLIGYARVSTSGQNLSMQIDALKAAGCDQIYTDKQSGVLSSRPGLDKALCSLKSGDVLVVYKLDRASRSLHDLINLVTQLGAKDIGFQSLTESLDTKSPGGKLIFHIFSALAEFERELIISRTAAGLAAAKARGVRGGRPSSLTSSQAAAARKLLKEPGVKIRDVCSAFKVSRATLYRHLSQDKETGRDSSP